MDGLALKHLGVGRVTADKYYLLTSTVQWRFHLLFGNNLHFAFVPSYSSKETFGDADALICPEELPQDWREKLAEAFSSRGFVKNGPVTSMEIANFQFDFISTTSSGFDKSYTYFAFNDLGNLMGRVAHKMGFKYGHEGLKYVLRDESKNHVLAEIHVDATSEEIFEFLGYSYSRWKTGFNTLEDIFEFTASSEYFSPDIYLLYNRNHVSRIRDAKRKTYQEFLVWCKDYKGPVYNWDVDKDALKALHLERAFSSFPMLKLEVQKELEKAQEVLKLKQTWNGENVMLWTNLRGKELGVFMQKVQEHQRFKDVCYNSAQLEKLVRENYEGKA